MSFVRKWFRSAVRAFGYDLVPTNRIFSTQRESPDFDKEFLDIFRRVKPFTMTSPERAFALYESVKYIVRNDIPGDIVECGVWKGGSMALVAHTLLQLGAADRQLVLFDTFDGMSAPDARDVDLRGRSAEGMLRSSDKSRDWVWASASLAGVQAVMRDTGYDETLVRYVEGKVEDTLPLQLPDRIAILRLDTDWYTSTHHELTHLYPNLTTGGVLILDDYGHWQGAKRAVDEYFTALNSKVLLNRIDYTGRICVKWDGSC